MTQAQPDWKRRAMLAGGALAVFAWVKGAPHLLSLRTPDLAYEDLPGLAPFRWLARAGAVTTGGNVVFLGLDKPKPTTAADERAVRLVRNSPCAAFYGRAVAGPVPIAMFSDFACPICRQMNERLDDLHAKAPNVFRIVRHQLPILGVASTIASRAVLAADKQGAYLTMHDRLERTPAVTDMDFVGRMADDIGLDRDRFLTDMNGAGITQQLRQTNAIAKVFGFYGTPAFAVGRTVFLGALGTSALEDLIAEEAGNPCQA